MGKLHEELLEHHKTFIEKQHIFFVSSAPLSSEGHINLSPKGLDCFRVLSSNRVAYMDLISSGNETSAHILENGRITFMFCSFDEVPNILRIYGKGFAVLPGENDWTELSEHFKIYPSTRQIIVADITAVQTSCGFGVPQYHYAGERNIYFEWAGKKDAKGLEQYMEEKNLYSLDGLPTKILRTSKLRRDGSP